MKENNTPTRWWLRPEWLAVWVAVVGVVVMVAQLAVAAVLRT